MIAVLIGTRPEFIKLAPVLRELELKKIPFILIHSGQHYSKALDSQILTDLNLPKPNYNLNVGSGSQAEQTGKIMVGVERVLEKEKPKILVVHGDTNTMLAGSLAAVKLHIPVAHVEAGLRSFDNNMPEEINRIITDRISDLLFVPTEGTKQNLLRDGIDEKKIFITGNTIVDLLNSYLPNIKSSNVLKQYKIEKNNYILVTAHRAENVDRLPRLKKLVDLLAFATTLLNEKIIWPIHPRTKNRLLANKIKLPSNIQIVAPTNYSEMLSLINYSYIVLTDSGGIQEESYILKKWVVTLRNSTERPETLSANFLIDLDKDKLKNAITVFKEGNVSWSKDVLGKGLAGELIVEHLSNFLKGK